MIVLSWIAWEVWWYLRSVTCSTLVDGRADSLGRVLVRIGLWSVDSKSFRPGLILKGSQFTGFWTLYTIIAHTYAHTYNTCTYRSWGLGWFLKEASLRGSEPYIAHTYAHTYNIQHMHIPNLEAEAWARSLVFVGLSQSIILWHHLSQFMSLWFGVSW